MHETTFGRMTVALAVAAAALTSGCATNEKQTLYRWGNYENLVYLMYAEPGKAEPAEQVQTLSADIEQTIAAGQRVPPGVYAHLGYMQFQQGNLNQAREEFASERELYPESSVFVDRVIKQLESEK